MHKIRSKIMQFPRLFYIDRELEARRTTRLEYGQSVEVARRFTKANASAAFGLLAGLEAVSVAVIANVFSLAEKHDVGLSGNVLATLGGAAVIGAGSAVLSEFRANNVEQFVEECGALNAASAVELTATIPTQEW
jgi:predicted dinucleotide-utilizing enzyme